MYPTYVRGFLAQDIELEVDMVTFVTIDKILLLRSRGSCNEIALNFRGPDYDDISVQETVNNESIVLEFFPLPQPMGEPLHVHVRLVGTHLTIWVNHSAVPVVDQEFAFQLVEAGRVGLALFGGEVHYDNFSATAIKATR
jgi:hypothetical protein